MPIVPGTPVDALLQPGSETEVYAFDAAPGSRLFFDLLSATSTDVQWRLLSPANAQVWTSLLGDVGPVALPVAGRYTLLVEGRRNAAADDAPRFVVVPVQDATIDVALGQQVGLDLRSAAGAPALGGSALLFDTATAVLAVGDALNLRDDLTFEAWIRPDRYPDTWTPILVKGNAAGERTYSLWLNAAGYVHLSVIRNGANQNVSTAIRSIQLGRWTHVAGVVQRSGPAPQLRLYIDGVLVASANLGAGQGADLPLEQMRVGAAAEPGSALRRRDRRAAGLERREGRRRCRRRHDGAAGGHHPARAPAAVRRRRRGGAGRSTSTSSRRPRRAPTFAC